MLKKLKNNIGLKILSVLIAILFWLIVYMNENPIETKQIEINLTPINESYLAEENLRILNDYATTVGVTVKGRKSHVEAISSNDFLAFIDFAGVVDENVEYIEVSNLSYIGSNNITYDLAGSGRIGITVDRIISGEVPIEVELSGEPAEGFVVTGITAKPAKYTILEIQSLVQDVAEAIVYVDVTGMKGTETLRKLCIVYDSNGEVITELSNQMAIDITVGIAKEVPIEVKLEGTPANDRLVTSATVNPETVLIQGSEENLAGIRKIFTAGISVEGAEGSFTAITGLTGLPVGTGYVGSGEVEVNVVIESLFEKTINIRKNDIEIRWGLPETKRIYVIQNNSVQVKIKGKQSTLDTINAINLSPYIDVSQQPDGVISLPLRFDSLMGVEQTGFPLVDVFIQTKQGIAIKTEQIILENTTLRLYDYSFVNTEELLEIQGNREDLNELNINNLNAKINVDNLGVGTHTVEIKVNLPVGVKLSKDFTTILVISEKQ